MCLVPDPPKPVGPRQAPRAPDLSADANASDARARKRATLASMVRTPTAMGAAPTAAKPTLGA